MMWCWTGNSSGIRALASILSSEVWRNFFKNASKPRTFGCYNCILFVSSLAWNHSLCRISESHKGIGNYTFNSTSLPPLRTFTSNWHFPTPVSRTIATVTILVVLPGTTHCDCTGRGVNTGVMASFSKRRGTAAALSSVGISVKSENFVFDSDCTFMSFVQIFLRGGLHRFYWIIFPWSLKTSDAKNLKSKSKSNLTFIAILFLSRLKPVLNVSCLNSWLSGSLACMLCASSSAVYSPLSNFLLSFLTALDLSPRRGAILKSVFNDL